MKVPPLILPPLEDLLPKPKEPTENAELAALLRSLAGQQRGSPAQPAPQPTLPRAPEQKALGLCSDDV